LGVTPFLKGKALKNATKSPYLRFQAAKEKFGTKCTISDSFAESIDLPDIESKSSDLTDDINMDARKNLHTRKSTESATSIISRSTLPRSIPEENEDEKGEYSPEDSIHWAYNEKGVTPYTKGKKSIEKVAKSPIIRFKDAKNKFATSKNSQEFAITSPGNVASIVRRRSSNGPVKSPRHAKIVRKGSGGLVSARVMELNSRVDEVRKMKRMRKKMMNPRLHTHQFSPNSYLPLRNRALLTYKTSTADVEKCNAVHAAKFNVIPDVDDEDSSLFSSGSDPKTTKYFAKESSIVEYEDDDVSKLSHATYGTNETGTTGATGTTIATVVQQRDHSIRSRPYSGSIASSAASSASSGFSNVKKQMFRPSDGVKSYSSKSTTLSSIIQKENEFFPPAALHLSPLQKTPMQAQKWRELASAAMKKDADARSNTKPKNKMKRALGDNSNIVNGGNSTRSLQI